MGNGRVLLSNSSRSTFSEKKDGILPLASWFMFIKKECEDPMEIALRKAEIGKQMISLYFYIRYRKSCGIRSVMVLGSVPLPNDNRSIIST